MCNENISPSELNVADSCVQGLARTYQGTKIGLLLMHGNNSGQMPFLPPPMRGTHRSWTRVHWVQASPLPQPLSNAWSLSSVCNIMMQNVRCIGSWTSERENQFRQTGYIINATVPTNHSLYCWFAKWRMKDSNTTTMSRKPCIHVQPTMYRIAPSLSVLTAIIPGGPEVAGTRMSPFWILLDLRTMEVVVKTGAIRRRHVLPPDKSLPPANPNFLKKTYKRIKTISKDSTARHDNKPHYHQHYHQTSDLASNLVIEPSYSSSNVWPCV